LVGCVGDSALIDRDYLGADRHFRTAELHLLLGLAVHAIVRLADGLQTDLVIGHPLDLRRLPRADDDRTLGLESLLERRQPALEVPLDFLAQQLVRARQPRPPGAGLRAAEPRLIPRF